LIAASGPISVAHYMAEANTYYYATRDPLGMAGDFITAPEISQIFGELVGLWLADLWMRAGRPTHICYVELGPGRGTLAADALRAMAVAGLEPEVHFIETSPVLRAAQQQRVPDARWHDDISTLPQDGSLLIVANEFFDALPVHQFVAVESGWREMVVDYEAGRFVRVPGPVSSHILPAKPVDTMIETSPASIGVVRELARRIDAQGGAALIFDYGPARSGAGDTLQAVQGHEYADPWANPGTCDLTAHVDFEMLGKASAATGVRVSGAIPQGQWLKAMGIDLRSARLAKAAPERSDEIANACARLTSPNEMGTLFKAMALVAPSWPEPAGFD
jgi:SAM-dependent MidA family methyltransferase